MLGSTTAPSWAKPRYFSRALTRGTTPAFATASLAVQTAQPAHNTGHPPMDNRELTAILH